MRDRSVQAIKVRIPSIIRRNTLFISINQALFSAVMQSMVVIAGLGVFLVTGSAALAAFAASIVIGGRVLIVYSAGKLMDRVGRKRVLYLGAILALGALGVMVLGLSYMSNILMWTGIFIFGIASGIVGLNRVAVMDMYPLSRRGEGMGYYLTGSVVGSVLAVALTAIAAALAFTGTLQYIFVILLCMIVLAVATLFIWLVKPDTRQIGQNLNEYYPEFTAPVAPCVGEKATAPARYMQSVPMRTAFIASTFAWGTMVMDMSLVSVILKQYGFELTLISIAVTIHIFGMFGLSIPLGRLADRWGRKPVIALGGIILAIGAALMPLTKDYLVITFGVFLVGLGWSGANVGTTALICDLTPIVSRGKVLGTNDLVTGAASIAIPLIGGAILSSLGYVVFGVVGLAFSIPVLLIVIVRETSPGKYEM